jgi:glycosyltransferase involved in cell wall biosynthesis
MAASLPAVATAVGDVSGIVSEDNLPLIVDRFDEAAFSAALDSLADQPRLRRAIGAANRAKAAAEYEEGKMIASYAKLYGEAIGRPDAFATAVQRAA